MGYRQQVFWFRGLTREILAAIIVHLQEVFWFRGLTREISAREDAVGGAHVLIFPCAAQGHVNSMLKLAELLALSNLQVTFLNTNHIHLRLLSLGHIQARLACYPTLQFKAIPDGLPANHASTRNQLWEVSEWLKSHSKPLFRDILVSESPGKPRVTCIIADGYLGGFTTDVADELGIPIIHFRTISSCCVWAYFCVPKLFECNELPIRGEGDEDMDRIITSIPGMENLIRCRDLPSFCRGRETDQIPLESVVFETQQQLRARAIILNTFEDLEGPVLSQIRLHFPKVYTLGPLHALLSFKKLAYSKTPSSKSPPSSTNNSFWEVDRTCLAWLDSQPLKSVIYVSFGSITVMKREELMEIWHGLVNSKKRFLWVIRPDMVAAKDGDHGVPAELVEGTQERGFMVGWAPQEEVLAHKAVGGFLTHSGWNSTLESVVAGVPMICWPYFADQQINSRFVSEVWKVGLDMKDVCDRNVVVKMVNDLMVERKEEFVKSVEAMAVLAKKSVSEGGSSYTNLDHLIEYIKSTSQGNH